jgi:hypothetical protein
MGHGERRSIHFVQWKIRKLFDILTFLLILALPFSSFCSLARYIFACIRLFVLTSNYLDQDIKVQVWTFGNATYSLRK